MKIHERSGCLAFFMEFDGLHGWHEVKENRPSPSAFRPRREFFR